MSDEEQATTMKRLLLIAATLALAACASTTIRDAWVDPDHRGGPFRRLIVLGVSDNISERRIFEDLMVARLAAAGVDAVPAYRHLPAAAEPALDNAVRASGADGLLMSRIRAVDRKTQFFRTFAPAPRFGWYGWYSGWYPVAQVHQYDVTLVETTLFAADGKRVVWTGTTETYEPRSVARDTPELADVIVKALRERALLPGGK